MPSLVIYVCSNNTENYTIYITFTCRALEKLRTHLFGRFFFLNTDSQSSPILKKVEGGGGVGAYLTVNAVLVARTLEGD